MLLQSFFGVNSMVNIDLASKEIALIHYIAGLATGKLMETKKGQILLSDEVYPLLRKLQLSLTLTASKME